MVGNKKLMLEILYDLKVDHDLLTEDPRYYFDIYRLAMTELRKRLPQTPYVKFDESKVGNQLITCLDSVIFLGLTTDEMKKALSTI